MDTARKAGLDPSKTASWNVVHTTANATKELIENKFAKTIVKPKPMLVLKSRNFEEIVISPDKRHGILN